MRKALDFILEFNFINWFTELVRQEYGGDDVKLVEKIVIGKRN